MARPASALPRVQVRMTEEMRDTIQQRAQAHFWNMNAEIVMLIERSLAAEAASAPSAS